MSAHARLAELLPELESMLREFGLWSAREPHPGALASMQPFCIDTLSFEQWLQFVFLPRMQALLATEASLPSRCAIAEMAEIHFGGEAHGALLVLLREIDVVLTTAPAPTLH